MADPEIFIVSRLNDCFGLDLTLVDFDEKAPLELLQLLLDVLADLDPRLRGDVRDAGAESSAGRAADLLRLLKYPPLRDRADADGYQKWVDAAAAGATTTVHPALHWLLGDVERHRTRAYVARFLAPVDVPPHLLDDAALREAFEHHRALQRDFRDAHRAVVASRAAAARGDGGALRAEARQLEAERAQLEAKVAALRRRGADVPDFDRLLAATRGLRLAQDEDARLRETAARQREAARRAEAARALREARLGRLRAGVGAARTADELIDVARRDVEALERQAGAAEAARRAPAAAAARREDAAELQRRVGHLEARVEELRARCRDACEARGDATLRSFRATAQIVARRLAEKSAAVDGLEVDLEAARRALAAARSAPAAGPGGGGGPDARRFGERLRRTTRDYKAKQERLRALRGELVVAHRTERVLRGRAGDLDRFLDGLEGARGVRGYRGARARLAAAAGRQEASDAAKAGELEAAAGRARAAAGALRARKAELAPRIAALREARAGFAAARGAFETKRRAYDAVAAAAEADVRRLGREADAHQEAALAEESRFHYLNCLCGVARAAADRARAEDARRAAPAAAPRLLPDFAGYAELYAHKGDRQRALVDQLRRRKAGLDRGAAPRRRQRARFEHLRALLAARLAARGARAPDAAAAEYDLGHARVAQFA